MPIAASILSRRANFLACGTTTGARIERACRGPPQCFRQEFFVRRGDGIRTDIRCALGALVRSLIVVESTLHVDAIDGIVDAVLNVSEVAHGLSPELLIPTPANADRRTVFHGAGAADRKMQREKWNCRCRAPLIPGRSRD